jgi:hypothetical protein
MKIRKVLVLLLLLPALFASGCAPTTAYGRLDRGPTPDASILARDAAATCLVSDSTPVTYPLACHADIRI